MKSLRKLLLSMLTVVALTLCIGSAAAEGGQLDGLITKGEQGEVEAQLQLGDAYYFGNGTRMDLEQAFFWYEKAARQGHPMAQRALGALYKLGKGTDRAAEMAAYWYEQAAEQGYAMAQTNLGILYETGEGVAQNLDTARNLYEQAAEQGDARGQTNLGRMYELGTGVAVDHTKALSWYEKAAKQGYARAQTNLGALYEAGQGMEQEYMLAVTWYTKAAQQGYARGQLYLGRMFEQGLGVEKDPARAADWYSKAAAQGYARAREQLAGMKLESAQNDEIARIEKQEVTGQARNEELTTAPDGQEKKETGQASTSAAKPDKPITKQEMAQELKVEAAGVDKPPPQANNMAADGWQNFVNIRPDEIEAEETVQAAASAVLPHELKTKGEVAQELQVQRLSADMPTPQTGNMAVEGWQTLASIRPGDMEKQVEFEGIIEPYVIIDIGTPVEGIVQEVMVERSTVVKAGQLLLKLDSSVEKALVDKARSKAKNFGEIEMQKEKLAFAERAHDRIDGLFTKKAISNQKMDEAYTEMTISRQRLQKAEEDRHLAKLELKQAEALLAQRFVKSPISGIVLERYISQGEFVDNQPLLRVAQIDPLRIEVIAPSHMFGKIRPGMKAAVLPELQEFGSLSATVTIVDRVIDAASSSFAVRLEMPNPDYIIPSGLKCAVRFMPEFAPALAAMDLPEKTAGHSGVKDHADPKE